MLMTGLGIHYVRPSPEFVTVEDRLVCGIHLLPGPKADTIYGKVQITGDVTLEHYGLVVELDGRIKFQKIQQQRPVNIFEPGGATVNKSSVYHLICGKPEALIRDLWWSEIEPFQMRLHPTSSIFEFNLQIPTNLGPLPPTLSNEYVEVLYSIKVYRRTETGYIKFGEKPIKFYGSRALPETTLGQTTPVVEFGEKGIYCILKTCKSNYLTSEPINFSLDLKRKSEEVKIISIKFSLERIVAVNKKLKKVEQIESFNPKKLPKRAEFLVRGVFKNRKQFLSYDNYGLEISYLVKCEIDCGTSKICETLEIIVGTSRPQSSSTSAQSSGKGFASSIRARALSCVSLLSELSLFPPNYSNLSSRASSVASFESLPPHYDDLPKQEINTIESESEHH